MNTDVDKIKKDFEKVYESICQKESCINGKCMALDEQELALIHLCMDVLGNENGFNINNYAAQELFIVHKEKYLDNQVCDNLHVHNEPINYKKLECLSGFCMDEISELLIVYYVATLFYANDINTNAAKYIERSYAKVYAYFACLCLKTFRVLFINQIYIFIQNTNEEVSLDAIRKKLEYEEELLAGYVELMEESGRAKATREIVRKFGLIMGYEKALEAYIRIEEQRRPGFIAFDYKEGDTIEDASYTCVFWGMEYLLQYLKYIEKRIGNNTYEKQKVLETIENLKNNINRLKKVFKIIVEDEKIEIRAFWKDFEDIKGLINSFKKHLDNELIDLIEARK